MKRLIKTQRKTRIIAPKASRADERIFAAELETMIEMMGRIFKNQAIKALNVSTVNKFADVAPKEFADAQTGNFATIFLRLSRAAKKKLLARFNNSRLEALATKMLEASDDKTRTRLYNLIQQKVGINAAELAATEGMKAHRNALIKETAQWIQKTRDETLEEFTAKTLRAMTLGQGLDAITEGFDEIVETRKGHARFIAQNQINNFNSIMNKTRVQELGVTKGRWITEGDDKVRHSHADRDGKVFDLAKGCYSSIDGLWLLPQVDYNCRCDYEFILDDEGIEVDE